MRSKCSQLKGDRGNGYTTRQKAGKISENKNQTKYTYSVVIPDDLENLAESLDFI